MKFLETSKEKSLPRVMSIQKRLQFSKSNI